MTSGSRNPDVSPVRNASKQIIRKSHVSAASSDPMTDLKVAARMVTIRTTSIWNANHAISRPLSSFREENNDVDVPGT